MIRVKICGLTRPEDAVAAAEAGADFLGLVFAESPRQINAETASDLMRAVPRFKNWVGVFVDEPPENIVNLAARLRFTFAQLHGNESPENCRVLTGKGLQVIKAFRIQGGDTFGKISDFDVPYILFDSFSPARPGGTGRHFDWSLLPRQEKTGRFFVSGGLDENSVSELLSFTAPFGVDVSSGVEDSPGIKNKEKITRFIRAVRKRN
ncbi:MAG TPA: phosphoribosylanthranilate isomerase [Candidatus Omnitrophota bacterium]|nr:phosphoribosylanthranilate isomerase [Candidatus Omnitrophota bacterium]